MALLQPFSDLFAKRSVRIESRESRDCDLIKREISHAESETPAERLDAISLIDELANSVAVELLLDWLSS